MTSYTATRLPQHRGPAAWNFILPERASTAPLTGAHTADIVIIGAGFAGLSAARRITQLDTAAKVILLEAGHIAGAASGRNSGFMIDLPHDLVSDDYAGTGDDKSLTALNRQAIKFGRTAVEEYNIDPNYFDEAGKVNGAVSDAAHKANQSYAKHLDALGEGYKTLDTAQMFEMTGSRYYQSGLYTPGTVMLQPAGYVRGLANGLARHIAIYEHTPATAFARKGTDWHITTPNGAITTSKIILATNGHLESFGIAKGRLMQVFLFASMTPELDPDTLEALGGDPRWGITPSNPMGTTMRRIDSAQGGNRIITRTCASLRTDMVPTPNDIKRASLVQKAKFNARFPALNSIKMEFEWAGHLCLSSNGVSVAGEIDENVFSACVQNGLGTARGTLTGIAAAEQAFGATSAITQYFSTEKVPKRLPPRPFRDIGANAILRYKEWQARFE